ncbi:MAG TPA: hypothetical protein VMF91_02180 [Bryobacteraceae bacterium]|nr:hypothetical protein [Bryobacteraceae bacterium]
MLRLRLVPLLVATATLPAFGAIDTSLLALVPPGSKIVSGIDFDRARSSQFGQYMTARINTSDQELEHFVTETGFDPRRDIQQMLFVSNGPAEKGDSSKFAILARGNFDQDRITAAARTKGLKAQPFEGVDIFVDKSQHDGPSAFAFLGDGIGVMGDSETVKQIVSNRATASALDPALQAAINKTGTDNDAWFVSMMSGGFLAHHLNAQINGDQSNHEGQSSMPQAQALQSVLQSSGGIQFGTTIRVSFDAITRSPKDASSLADVVRFFASMVQMERQKDPRAGIAASAFDNMNLATDGDAMHLSISLPEKSLEQLIDSMPSHHAAADLQSRPAPSHAQ